MIPPDYDRKKTPSLSVYLCTCSVCICSLSSITHPCLSVCVLTISFILPNQQLTSPVSPLPSQPVSSSSPQSCSSRTTCSSFCKPPICYIHPDLYLHTSLQHALSVSLYLPVIYPASCSPLVLCITNLSSFHPTLLPYNYLSSNSWLFFPLCSYLFPSTRPLAPPSSYQSGLLSLSLSSLAARFNSKTCSHPASLPPVSQLTSQFLD